MKRRPFAVCGVSACCAALSGSLLCTWLPDGFACLAIGLALLTVGAVILFYSRHPRPVRSLPGGGLWSAAAAAAGLVLCVSFLWQRCCVLPAARLDGQKAVVGGVVSSIPDKSGSMYRYTLDTHLITIDGAPQKLKLNVYSLNQPQPGDSIYLTVTFRTPQTARETASLHADGITLNGFSYSDITVTQENRQPLTRLLLQLRQKLGQGFSLILRPNESAVARALLLGDKTLLSNTLYSDYRAAGLAHVLATSGMHTSVLVLAFYGALRLLRLRIRPACILTGAAVMVYMALVGFLPSVTRAGLMALLMLTARALSTRTDFLNSLGVSAWIMVTVFPPCISDISFTLSFCATLGICLCLPHVRHLADHLCRRFPKMLRFVGVGLLTALGTGFAANLFTLPLSMMYFETVSTVSVFATLPACLILNLLLPLLAGFALLTGVGIGGAFPEALASACGWLIDLLNTLANGFAQLPFAELPTGYRLVCAAVTVCIILFITLLLYRPLRRYTVFFSCAGALLICASVLASTLYLNSAATLIVLPDQSGSCVIVKCGSDVLALGSASEYQIRTAAGLLRSLGENEIDALLPVKNDHSSDWQANGITVNTVYQDRVGQRLDTVSFSLGAFGTLYAVYHEGECHFTVATPTQTMVLSHVPNLTADADVCILLHENARLQGDCDILYCVSEENARDREGYLMSSDQPVFFRITQNGIVRTNAIS